MEILQVSDFFELAVGDPNPVDRQLLAEAAVEVNVLAIRRPLWKANIARRQIRPGSCGKLV